MKEKILEILEKNLDYKPHVITGIEKCADEILRIAEFEALCNPDIYEASANEHFENQKEEESSFILGKLVSMRFSGDAQQVMIQRAEMYREGDPQECYEYGFYDGYEYFRGRRMIEIIELALEYGWLHSVPAGDDKEKLFSAFKNRLQ